MCSNRVVTTLAIMQSFLVISAAYAETPALKAEVAPAHQAEPQPAHPAAASPSGGSRPADPAAEEIHRINERITVLSARLAELRVEGEIAAQEEKIAKLRGAGDAKEIEKPPADRLSFPAAGAAPSPVMPVVRAIEGFDGKLRATIAFPGGGVRVVKEGDAVDAYRVQRIEVATVTLVKGAGGKAIDLHFGQQPASPAEPQGGAAGMGRSPALPALF